MPATITVTRSFDSAVKITEALIAADIIPEDYLFSVSLLETLQDALDDYVQDAVGPSRLQLALHYSDDTNNASISFDEWLRYVEHYCHREHRAAHRGWFDEQEDPEQPVMGFFGLFSTSWPYIHCKQVVSAAEALYPGAGFSLMAVAHDALAMTIGVACLDWVYEQIMRRDEEWSEEELRETARISKADFESVVPKQAISPKWDKEAVERMQEGERGQEETYLADAAKWALKVYELLDAYVAACKIEDETEYGNAIYCQAHAHEEEVVLPALLSWCDEDGSHAELDDYHEMIGNCGYSNCVWMQAFPLRNMPECPFTIERAARVLKALIDLLGWLDGLLDMLAGTQRESSDTPSPEWVSMQMSLKRRGVTIPEEWPNQFHIDQSEDLAAEHEEAGADDQTDSEGEEDE